MPSKSIEPVRIVSSVPLSVVPKDSTIVFARQWPWMRVPISMEPLWSIVVFACAVNQVSVLIFCFIFFLSLIFAIEIIKQGKDWKLALGGTPKKIRQVLHFLYMTNFLFTSVHSTQSSFIFFSLSQLHFLIFRSNQNTFNYIDNFFIFK